MLKSFRLLRGFSLLRTYALVRSFAKLGTPPTPAPTSGLPHLRLLKRKRAGLKMGG